LEDFSASAAFAPLVSSITVKGESRRAIAANGLAGASAAGSGTTANGESGGGDGGFGKLSKIPRFWVM
jgi:hypothetical protein